MTGTTNTTSKWWWLPGALMLLAGSLFLFMAYAKDKGALIPGGIFWFILAAGWFAKARNLLGRRAAGDQSAATGPPDRGA